MVVVVWQFRYRSTSFVSISLIITLYYEYQLDAETCVKFTMSDLENADSGFPWFEEKNFSGWLTQ
jgi:hypothetical protein